MATDYWAAHGDDQVTVRLIDLASAVARMRQVAEEGIETAPVEHDRIFTCDLPRLARCLPPEAAAELGDVPPAPLPPAAWPLFLHAVAETEDYWTTASREGLPAGGVPFIPMKIADFMLYLTEAVLALVPGPPQPRFLDVGAGPGTKTRLAEALGLAAEGIEVSATLVREANRHRDPPLVIHADARDWDGYGRYDVVLLNRPVDGRQMPAFEAKVMKALRPGAVLIHANGWTSPADLGWHPVYVKTPGNPVTGVWRKPR